MGPGNVTFKNPLVLAGAIALAAFAQGCSTGTPEDHNAVDSGMPPTPPPNNDGGVTDTPTTPVAQCFQSDQNYRLRISDTQAGMPNACSVYTLNRGRVTLGRDGSYTVGFGLSATTSSPLTGVAAARFAQLIRDSQIDMLVNSSRQTGADCELNVSFRNTNSLGGFAPHQARFPLFSANMCYPNASLGNMTQVAATFGSSATSLDRYTLVVGQPVQITDGVWVMLTH